jgi:hypothetical protein
MFWAMAVTLLSFMGICCTKVWITPKSELESYCVFIEVRTNIQVVDAIKWPLFINASEIHVSKI